MCSFRNHYNILICFLRNISSSFENNFDAYFFVKPVIYFSDIWWMETSKEKHLLMNELIHLFITVFTV